MTTASEYEAEIAQLKAQIAKLEATSARKATSTADYIKSKQEYLPNLNAVKGGLFSTHVVSVLGKETKISIHGFKDRNNHNRSETDIVDNFNMGFNAPLARIFFSKFKTVIFGCPPANTQHYIEHGDVYVSDAWALTDAETEFFHQLMFDVLKLVDERIKEMPKKESEEI